MEIEFVLTEDEFNRLTDLANLARLVGCLSADIRNGTPPFNGQEMSALMNIFIEGLGDTLDAAANRRNGGAAVNQVPSIAASGAGRRRRGSKQ